MCWKIAKIFAKDIAEKNWGKETDRTFLKIWWCIFIFTFTCSVGKSLKKCAVLKVWYLFKYAFISLGIFHPIIQLCKQTFINSKILILPKNCHPNVTQNYILIDHFGTTFIFIENWFGNVLSPYHFIFLSVTSRSAAILSWSFRCH